MICSIFGLLNCRMLITLWSVGEGTFTGPLTQSRSRVCWPAGPFSGRRRLVRRRRFAGTGAPGDGGRAFADGGGDPFDRSLAHVTGGEYPGQAGL